MLHVAMFTCNASMELCQSMNWEMNILSGARNKKPASSCFQAVAMVYHRCCAVSRPVSSLVNQHSSVRTGGRRGIKQSGRGVGGDHILVGGVGQVDSLHPNLWGRSYVAGATLSQTEVSPQQPHDQFPDQTFSGSENFRVI